MISTIAIITEPTAEEKAQALAQRFSLPIVKNLDPHYAFHVQVTNEAVSLITRDLPGKPIMIDFLSEKSRWRQQSSRGFKEPIIKAAGVRPNQPCSSSRLSRKAASQVLSPMRQSRMDGDQRGKIAISPFGNPHREMLSGNRCQACYIVDGTAGFGQDAWLFAQCGCRVELVERNPAMVMLLEDAIARADIETMQVVWADAKEHLSSLKQQSDVVYLDPMFPERKKSALVKRNMQALQLLADAPQDEAALLDAALIAATKRVVVKRPKWADPLPGPAPSFNVETKGYRFDVYVCAANASG